MFRFYWDLALPRNFSLALHYFSRVLHFLSAAIFWNLATKFRRTGGTGAALWYFVIRRAPGAPIGANSRDQKLEEQNLPKITKMGNLWDTIGIDIWGRNVTRYMTWNFNDARSSRVKQKLTRLSLAPRCDRHVSLSKSFREKKSLEKNPLWIVA